MEKIGFTIGKFAPFHKGHEYLIETALKQTDKVYVIVNDAQEINTPIETRAKWIKDQYPQVEIIYGYHPPKQYGMESTKYVEECGILISNVPSYMKRIEEKEYVSRSQHLVFTKLLSKNDRDGSSEYSFEYSKW